MSSAAWAQKSNVLGTKHNVGGTGCKSCHASHNGAQATALAGTTVDQGSGQILLWDRSFSTVTFTVYDSPSLKNKAAEIGGGIALNASENRMNSLLCMSCHDGVTTTNLNMPATR